MANEKHLKGIIFDYIRLLCFTLTLLEASIREEIISMFKQAENDSIQLNSENKELRSQAISLHEQCINFTHFNPSFLFIK